MEAVNENLVIWTFFLDASPPRPPQARTQIGTEKCPRGLFRVKCLGKNCLGAWGSVRGRKGPGGMVGDQTIFSQTFCPRIIPAGHFFVPICVPASWASEPIGCLFICCY